MRNAEVLSRLKEKGVAKASVYFYGGNDEGQVESFTFTDVDGDNVEGVQNDLEDVLEEPIEERYGGFGGDFSVSGTLIWDVAESKVYFEVSESEYIEHTYEVND